MLGPRRPLQELVRDRPIRVSSLGLLKQCLLRLGLGASHSTRPLLPAGPWAEFGRAIHIFLERCANPSKADWDWFRAELLAGNIKGRSAALGDREVSLTRMLPAELLLRRVGRLRVGRARRRRMEVMSGTERRPAVFLEERVKGARGELVGRIDRLERWPDGRWTITDVKSGRLRREGELRSDYVTQVAAYAFLLREREGPVGIDLRLVGSDGNWGVRFSADLQSRVEILLAEVRRRLPRGLPRPAQGLASPGNACRACRYRPLCGRYLAEAPGSWHSPGSTYPLDRWGAVERIKKQGRLLEVLLRDPMDRLTLVTGVPERLLPTTLKVGSQVWFFGLHATSGSSRTWFHVLNPERGTSSAHGVGVFHDASHDRSAGD